MEEKVLSVIVPVYNTEVYLRKCLDSLIIDNGSNDLEVLVIIDGSPDNSVSIAKEYEKKYSDTFRVIDKENGGHGSCCNVGIREAKGKYIHFLDSDDWFETETLSYLIKRLRHVEVDAFFTKSVKEYVYENRTEPYSINFQYSNEILEIENVEILNKLGRQHFFNLADCGFRKEIFKKNYMSFSEKTSFDDTFLYIAPFLSVRKILFINQILYHYFIGRSDQSISCLTPAKYSQKGNELLKCLSLYNKFDNSYPNNVMKYVRSFGGILIDGILISIFQSKKEDRKDFYKRLKKLMANNSILSGFESCYFPVVKYCPYTLSIIMFYILRKLKEKKN